MYVPVLLQLLYPAAAVFNNATSCMRSLHHGLGHKILCPDQHCYCTFAQCWLTVIQTPKGTVDYQVACVCVVVHLGVI